MRNCKKFNKIYKISNFKFQIFKFQIFQILKYQNTKIINNLINKQMKRLPLHKSSQTKDGQINMSLQNLKICIKNQQGYQTLHLNNSLHLQFYNFVNIDNLDSFVQSNGENSQQKYGYVQKFAQTSGTISAQTLLQQQPQMTQTINQAILKHQSKSPASSHSPSNDNKQIQGPNTIFLNNNLIETIQNLGPLRLTLITLNLSHNRIKILTGLKQLLNLCILDLSYNKIDVIQTQQIQTLINLKRINLNSNCLTNQQSIKGISSVGKTLQTLQLANNQSFQPTIEVLSNVFSKMYQLKLLILKDTPFVRKTSGYRKQTILACPSLTFLDQRTVTQDQRILANAWKRGGLKEERQARKLLNEKKEQKNINILAQIQQRNKAIDEKVQKLYQQKGRQLISELQNLQNYIKSSDFQLINSQQQSLIKLKVQQLQHYLSLLRQQCRYMDIDRQLGLTRQQCPRMFIQKRTQQNIYIYNVSQIQLKLIKQKYYIGETLPIIAVNYQKPQQLQWISQYDAILNDCVRVCKGNWEMVVVAFNLDIYDFDKSKGRKLRRFSDKDILKLKQKYAKCQGKQHNYEEDQGFIVNRQAVEVQNTLNDLD